MWYKFVSAKTKSSSDMISSRSARSFVCCMDSSPETYNVRNFFSAICEDVCSNRVDFPIPGSPPIKTSDPGTIPPPNTRDRKSTRLNSSHVSISYAVFCLKKKTTEHQQNKLDSY